MPNIDRPEPPYLQVVRNIRDGIVSGRLAAGDTVPSARQIAADWSIALATATKALSTLRAEGLVRGVPGVGTVVVDQAALTHSAKDRALAIHRTGRIYPPGHYARIRAVEMATAPEQVVSALGLATGAAVIRRQRTTYDEADLPLSTSTSWFDGDLAATCPGLLKTDRIREGTAGYIERQTGRLSVSGRDQLCAGAAGAEDAAELGIAEGAPVMLGRNRYIDGDGAVLEYGESVSPAGRWAFYEYSIRSDQ